MRCPQRGLTQTWRRLLSEYVACKTPLLRLAAAPQSSHIADVCPPYAVCADCALCVAPACARLGADCRQLPVLQNAGCEASDGVGVVARQGTWGRCSWLRYRGAAPSVRWPAS
jgi:hypothetical protein